MAKLIFDEDGKRFYETGVRNCVLYVKGTEVTHGSFKTPYSGGVAWNGITAISESPEGAEPNAIYADDMKYLNLLSLEEFNASVEAYTYPDEFGVCNGEEELLTGFSISQQKRSQFGLCYRTTLGNDEDGNDHGFKLHIIYGCLAAPSESAYNTINDSPEAISFSWELSTTPVKVTISNKEYTVSHLEIDSTKVDADALEDLMEALYGTDGSSGITPYLPLPDEIYSILS